MEENKDKEEVASGRKSGVCCDHASTPDDVIIHLYDVTIRL